MKVSVVSKKLVKPCSPTPHNLKSYYISFIDELIPMPNLCVVLYYSPSSSSSFHIKQSLEESLSKILPDFYPLAGRYIKNERMVDCSDQGALFVVAQASSDVILLDVISSQQQPEDLFLPRDHYGDKIQGIPLLSVQLTEFSCGGIAITINICHRILDGSAFATFIACWAHATSNADSVPTHDRPLFNGPLLFPAKKLLPIIPSSSSGGVTPKIILKRFQFDQEAIVSLRTGTNSGAAETDPPSSRPPSRVLVVSALITRALIRIDRAKKGRSRDCTISQLVNMRPRLVPPLPGHTCGNVVTIAATPPIPAENAEGMGLNDLVGLLRDAVGKTLADCKKIVGQGEAGHAIAVDNLVGFREAVFGGEVNACWFSDFSKFGFYEIDFGWGKPVWAGAGSLDLPNGALLMADREGGGLEAWLHLDDHSMSLFEQDEEIKMFTK